MGTTGAMKSTNTCTCRNRLGDNQYSHFYPPKQGSSWIAAIGLHYDKTHPLA